MSGLGILLVKDIWNAYGETLLDLIKDAMRNNDFDLVRGIQSFDVSVWTGLHGVEEIISTLLALTIYMMGGMKKEAEELRRKLRENEDHYKKLGTYDALKKRLERLEGRWIYLPTLKASCRGLKNLLRQLIILRDMGFIEIEGTDFEHANIRLSPLWDRVIEEIANRGYETHVFGSAIGRMIALGIEGKGFRQLKPIFMALNTAEKNNNEISMDELRKKYQLANLPYRHLAGMIKRDNKKHADIRLFAYYNDKRAVFMPHAIRAYVMWRERANMRVREWRIPRA
jgi:hypothetical protein